MATYRLVSDTWHYGFSNAVNEMLDEGYVFFGDLKINNTNDGFMFIREMVKYEPGEDIHDIAVGIDHIVE